MWTLFCISRENSFVVGNLATDIFWWRKSLRRNLRTYKKCSSNWGIIIIEEHHINWHSIAEHTSWHSITHFVASSRDMIRSKCPFCEHPTSPFTQDLGFWDLFGGTGGRGDGGTKWNVLKEWEEFAWENEIRTRNSVRHALSSDPIPHSISQFLVRSECLVYSLLQAVATI